MSKEYFEVKHETIDIGMCPYAFGQRVEGLYNHRGRVGTVIDGSKNFVVVRWDGGKRKSTVEVERVRAIA